MKKYTIGIDEVGRGALAGPVTVAAVALPRNFNIWRFNLHRRLNLPKLRDSKKLSPRQREKWAEFIKQQKIPFAIASISPKIIDKINISQAANLAASRAFTKLVKICKLNSKNCRVFLDGGLYLGKQKNFLFLKPKRKRSPLTSPSQAGAGRERVEEKESFSVDVQTIIRGDEKIPAIALASIIAKVHRDRLMKRLHKKYPRYDFCDNVGYGTSKHIRMVRKFGRCKIHRRSFLIKKS